MTTTTKTIEQIIREMKEYEQMKKELQKELDELKDLAIQYLADIGSDEYSSDEGKITYREVLSKRFATTEFRKRYAELYLAFSHDTVNMRFTLN